MSTGCNKDGIPFMSTTVLRVKAHVVLSRYARKSAVLCKSYHSRLYALSNLFVFEWQQGYDILGRRVLALRACVSLKAKRKP